MEALLLILGPVESSIWPLRDHFNLSAEFLKHLAVVDQGGRKAKKKASLRRHPRIYLHLLILIKDQTGNERLRVESLLVSSDRTA